jgi:RNA polymerase sigma factor (sigma-70 family)
MTIEEYNSCVDSFSDNIFRFILKNIKDEDKAKDIVQDTYEKMWIKADTVSFNKARSYLFTTAYHTMIDLLRKEKRIENFNSIKPDNYSHNEQYSDLNEILHQAVNKLPDTQRAVIILRDYEGYTYDEISEITGLSEIQVKVYIYRGRMFLKNYIGKLEIII